MSAIASNEAPIIAQAAVPAAPLAGTVTEKRLGHGSISGAVQERPASFDEDDEVTEEELHTLRRVSGKIPWPAFTVAFVELCERFSYYGTTVVCKSTAQETPHLLIPLTIASRQLHPTTSPGRLIHWCWL